MKTAEQEAFWRQYGERWGEDILGHTLARYISGWPEFAASIWGLAIATSRGFRFHHFPHEGWIQSLSRSALGGEAPAEKLIFIPRERIISAKVKIEKTWWKKLLFPRPPILEIRYREEAGPEMVLLVETDQGAEALVRNLNE